MFSLSSHVLGREECQPLPGISIVEGLLLAHGFLKVSQEPSLFPAPHRFERQRSELGNLW